MSGFMIAAPQSGAGKTTVTLGLLRALRKRGKALAPGKVGPDYIDPAFHAAASGEPCLNYDPWAMRTDLILANAGLQIQGGRLMVIEAMMGLFDAAAGGKGSAGDLAALLRLPVVLVVDCARLSHSVAAIASGFANFHPEVLLAGVVLNRVGSDRHERMLRAALQGIRMPVFGVIPRRDELTLPERHLGLVQAGEHPALEAHLEGAAALVETAIDIDALLALTRFSQQKAAPANILRLPPPGQRVAVAKDIAFGFAYEHMLLGWRRRGAEILPFSPLADEAPSESADAIFLPGGYPELHAGRIAAANTTRAGLKAAADKGITVYGECGGFMALGEALVDARGESHAMFGLLPLVTSYAQRERHLGYRVMRPRPGFFWDMPCRGHEFHHSTIISEGKAERLFDVSDAEGEDLPAAGLMAGNVSGSYMHVIDRAD